MNVLVGVSQVERCCLIALLHCFVAPALKSHRSQRGVAPRHNAGLKSVRVRLARIGLPLIAAQISDTA
jgi:hypothetical protein